MFPLQVYLILIKCKTFALALTDVDIVSKLAHWRLLDLLPTVFGCEVTDLATLPSLIHRAKNACITPDRIFRDVETAKYAYDFLLRMGTLPSPDPDVISVLQRYPKIDAGEAILLAVATEMENSILATGDKNAIQGLYPVYQSGLFANLKARLICLEQILECCLQHLGLSALQDKIKLSLDQDIAVKNIFGSRCDATIESVESGLNSYIDNLRNNTGDLLFK